MDMDPDGMELITAAATGLTVMAQDCLDKGIDIHTGDDMPLRTAVMMGNKEMVHFLVDKGANVKAAGSEALLFAAKREDAEMADYLLSKGADIDAMMRAHKKEIDQGVIDVLDQLQSGKLRAAFEKNFAKVKDKRRDLKLPPKAPKP